MKKTTNCSWVTLPNCKKLLLTMKLFIAFIFIGMLQAFAGESYSQSARISLAIKDASIEEVLNEIESQSEFYFLFNQKLIDVNREVDLSVENVAIKDVLAQLFDSDQVKCLVYDRQIILVPRESSESALLTLQQFKVSGQVIDANTNSPLPGVYVIIEGTNTGVTTDVEGRYAIEVPNGQTVLNYSFIGYVTESIIVGTNTTINVSLVPDIQALEEVVVVGYGVQRKIDVAGSIAVAKAEDVLKNSSFNAMQGLKGKASGVNIFTNSGNPSGNTRVVIRGINSINTTSDPLYVVDGVQMTDFQFVNPNDIERIEVLKDASAAAIYGARGANGVILITTKRGSGEGDGLTVSYNGWVSLGQLARKADLMNAEEFMRME